MYRHLVTTTPQDDEEEADDADPGDKEYSEAVYRAMASSVDLAACLDLNDYANHLIEDQGERPLIRTLGGICKELLHPFRDQRGSWAHHWKNGPLKKERLFELLTAETLESLRPTTLTLARAMRWERGQFASARTRNLFSSCTRMPR